MQKPSNTAYHLGHTVTAHAALTTALILIIAFSAPQELMLSAIAPITGTVTVILPILAAEPTRRREGTKQFGIANQITLFRLFLIANVALLIGSTPPKILAEIATYVSIMALVLDGIDGIAARKTNTESLYGAQFDMEVDAFFTLVLSLLVFQWEHAGPWVLFCGLARYAWLGVQLRVPWFNRPLPPEPAFRRKTACVMGVGGLALALFPWSSSNLNTGLAAVATLSLLISFALDTRWLIAHRKEPLP